MTTRFLFGERLHTITTDHFTEDELLRAFRERKMLNGDPERTTITLMEGPLKGERVTCLQSDQGPLVTFIMGLRQFDDRLVHVVEDFNPRGDSPELSVILPELLELSASYQLALTRSWPILRQAYLEGRFTYPVMSSCSALLKICSKWGQEATIDAAHLVLALVASRSYLVEGTLVARMGQILELPEECTALNGPISWTAIRKLYATQDMDGVLEMRMKVAVAVVQRGWSSRVKDIYDLARPMKSWRSEVEMLSDLREFLQDDITDLDEFNELIERRPPAGYALKRVLSKNTGSKVVFSAVNTATERAVVLKRYMDRESPSVAKQLYKAKMGSDEMQQQDARIRHANILPCDVVGTKDGTSYIVEPMLDSTFEALLHAPVDVVGVLRLIEPVVDAVAYLHALDIFHGDIKLDNIGIEGGRPMLIDFGLASTPPHAPRSNPGSIRTRAPELFGDGVQLTAKSDVFALGATLFALLTAGDDPLLKKEEDAALEQMVLDRVDRARQDPQQWERDLSEQLVGCPSEVVALITSACAVDPKARPMAAEWRDRMQAISP